MSAAFKTITLAGGGLVGSLLALVLARKGYKVEVFESRPDLRKEDISAGKSINLALANRGIKPLRDLGLMADIEKILITMSGRMVHIDGEQANLQAYGQNENEVIYSISRGQLNGYLMTQAENTGLVTFHFNHRIKSVNINEKTLLLSTINDNVAKNSTHHFDLIFGTDGANSPIRKAILGQSTHLENYQNDEQLLDHSYKELTIKASAEGKHKIEKNALHIWPRGNFMIIALPNLDGSFTVTLFLPIKSLPIKSLTIKNSPISSLPLKNSSISSTENNSVNIEMPSFSSINNSDELNQFFDQHFSDLKPLLDNLEHNFLNNPVGRLATVKCAPWSFENKALILGDAAHAIVPFHGQGMNCGFEDCDLVNQLLPNATEINDNFDWQEFFQSIEQQRKTNSDAIADMAIENYIEMRSSVAQADYLLKKQCAFKIQQWFPKRFSPRYAMVMFEHRTYREAFDLGEKHKIMLNELLETVNNIDQLTIEMAEGLLDKYRL